MPDSRLSITALVNGPLPTSPVLPSLSFPSPRDLPTLSKNANRNDSSYSYSNGYSNSNSWSSTRSPPPAPSSPQTIIVKTPRGKRHRCTFNGCGRDFTRLSNLKAHWRRHSGEEPYACMHCTRKFKWRSSLKSHELGCVYEYTKVNAGLRWVYVSSQTGDQARETRVRAPDVSYRGFEQRVPREAASISRQAV